MPKARSTLSPLGRGSAKSPIHQLALGVQEYLHLPDPTPLYVTIGTIVGNMMDGDPIWTMLVGPPGCGKTALLSSILDVEGIKPASSVKGPGAFLSGTPRKDAKGGTGGLLKEIGPRGMLMIKDFQSILTLSSETRRETIGAFRDVADGWWDRPIGADGGKTLKWRGRVGFLGACVPWIDSHSGVLSDLGERWIYYRYPYKLKDLNRGWGETQRKLRNRDREGMQREIRDLVAGFVEEMGFGWRCLDGCQEAHEHWIGEGAGPERRDLRPSEVGRLYAMAAVASTARSPVERSSRRGNEIISAPSPETPTRLSAMLAQLYLGLEAVGLGAAERWEIVGRVARDSVPGMRMFVLREIAERELGKVGQEGQGGSRGRGRELVTIPYLVSKTPVGETTLRYMVDDLIHHGLVEKRNRGGSGSGSGGGGGRVGGKGHEVEFGLTAEARENWRKAFEGGRA